MSVLVYGPVRMQIQTTEHFRFGGVPTEDGVDYTCTEIDYACVAIVNRMAVATAGPGVLARAAFAAPFLEDAPAPGAPGDSVGVSLRNLRAMLLTPRQALTFSIGGDTVVSATGPDARNGPQPQSDTRVLEIMGTTSARVYFHVKCWIADFVPGTNNAQRIVLANRFRVGSSMDEDYWTTRYVTGQMIVDAGQLASQAGPLDGLLTPDSFRSSCFLTVPQGFKRDNVEVTVSSDNRVLDYSYVDTETPLCLGGRSLATRIEGNCTAGSESPLRDMGVVATGAAAAAAGLAALAENVTLKLKEWFRGGQHLPGIDVTGGAAHVATLSIPRIKANGIVRIWGRRDADKAALMLLGINILSDRFQGLAGAFFNGKLPRFASLYVTQDLAERFVEVRGEFIPSIKSAAWNLIALPGDNIKSVMKLDTNIQSGGASGTDDPLKGDGTGTSPPPPNSVGTRGNWLGALVVSLLSTPGQVPRLPPDPVPVIDRANFI